MAMSKSFSKGAAWLIVCLTAIVFGQGCQSRLRGRTQSVPATSRPMGVMVIVDGKAVGKTPINLKLARMDIHVVRFELDGYRPVEIHMRKKRPSLAGTIAVDSFLAPVGGVVLGAVILLAWLAIGPQETSGDDEFVGLERILVSFLAGAGLGWTGGVIIDSHSPSNFDLSPQTLFVEMDKADGTEAPRVIEADYARLRQVRWIRIGTR